MRFGRDIPAFGIRQIGRWVTITAMVAGTGSAAVGQIEVSEVALEVEASSASGVAVLEIGRDALSWDGAAQALVWQGDGALQLLEPETRAVIATLTSALVEFRGCSKVTLNFALDAGDSDVTVIVRTGQLAFPTIAADSAAGRASASFTLSDLNGDGAEMVGLGGGGRGAFRAYFNGQAPDGSLFAHLVAVMSISGGGSGSASQRDPLFGYRAVGSAVSDMSVEVAFTLSALDRLSASTSFDINPDPDDCGADADGDGLPDWLDGCPDDPGKSEPGDCGCGMADLDSDADGVADCNDNCPMSANADQADADGDGVGDACDDADEEADEGDGDDGAAEPVGESVVAEDEADAADDGQVGEAEDAEEVEGGAPSGWPTWLRSGGGAGSASDDDDAEDAETVAELMSGAGGLCGYGAVALLPLALAGLGGCKLGGRERGVRRGIGRR